MNTDVKQIAIDSSLFEWPADDPCLTGSQCAVCGAITFPAQESCPKCGSGGATKTRLLNRGTLWTWTSQGFMPKSPYRGEGTPENFKPFYVGYVELPGQVRVESRLAVEDASELQIGMEMELVIIPFYTDDAGQEVMMYAFKPC